MFILKESKEFDEKFMPKIKAEFMDEVNAFYKDENKPVDKIIKAFPREEQACIYFLITQMPFKRPQVTKLIELANTKYSSEKDDSFNKLTIKLFKEEGIKDIGELNPYGDNVITFKEVYEHDLTGRLMKNDIRVYDTEMSSLLGAPEEVEGEFNISGNKLKSLQYCPKKVTRSFDCKDNKLTTMKYAPEYIGSTCWCDGNKGLISLEGLKYIDFSLTLYDTGFKSKEEIIEQLMKYKITVNGRIASDFGEFTMEDVKAYVVQKKMGKFKDLLDL